MPPSKRSQTRSTRKPRTKAASNATSFAERARSVSAPGKSAAVNAGLGKRALRKREHLIETALKLFLERGYGGTTIDDVSDAAGVSRASFYTYFPTKRDILLVAARRTRKASAAALAALSEVPDEWTLQDLRRWIRAYFRYLDEHGGVLFVWSQAAWADEELHAWGVKSALDASDIVGKQLERLGANNKIDSRLQARAIIAMLDRFWYVWHKVDAPFQEDEVIDGLARMVQSSLS